MALPVYEGDLVSGDLFNANAINIRLLPSFISLNPTLETFPGSGSTIGVGILNENINDESIHPNRVEDTACTTERGPWGEQIFRGPMTWGTSLTYSYEVIPDQTLDSATADNEVALQMGATTMLLTNDSDPGGGFFNVITSSDTDDVGREINMICAAASSFTKIDFDPSPVPLLNFKGVNANERTLTTGHYAGFVAVNDGVERATTYYEIGE